MGLDQWANRIDSKTNESFELAWWRKHPNLQGWMENLWNEKGGEGSFNCEDVELSLEDIDRLENAILEKDLPETEGFFFGGASDDYYKDRDLQFVEDARLALKEGDKVTYSSWW